MNSRWFIFCKSLIWKSSSRGNHHDGGVTYWKQLQASLCPGQPDKTWTWLETWQQVNIHCECSFSCLFCLTTFSPCLSETHPLIIVSVSCVVWLVSVSVLKEWAILLFIYSSFYHCFRYLMCADISIVFVSCSHKMSSSYSALVVYVPHQGFRSCLFFNYIIIIV